MSKYLTAGIYSKAFVREDGLIETRTQKMDWASKLILFSLQGRAYLPIVKDMHIKGNLLIRVLPRYEHISREVISWQRNLIDRPKTELPKLQKTLDAIYEECDLFDLTADLRWDLHTWNFMRNPNTGKTVLIDALQPYDDIENQIRIGQKMAEAFELEVRK